MRALDFCHDGDLAAGLADRNHPAGPHLRAPLRAAVVRRLDIVEHIAELLPELIGTPRRGPPFALPPKLQHVRAHPGARLMLCPWVLTAFQPNSSLFLCAHTLYSGAVTGDV